MKEIFMGIAVGCLLIIAYEQIQVAVIDSQTYVLMQVYSK